MHIEVACGQRMRSGEGDLLISLYLNPKSYLNFYRIYRCSAIQVSLPIFVLSSNISTQLKYTATFN